jgi:hypothetical protein
MKLSLPTFTILLLSAVGIAQAEWSASPFSRQDARLMSSVWPTIREARDFDDIDWRAVRLSGAPGDLEARRFQAEHWSQLRTAASFDDIDWRASGYESSDRSSPRGHGEARNGYNDQTGPFTRQEARTLRRVWPTIREAANFDDINWRAVGIARAPGDRAARDFIAADWDSLRRAAQFDDIDWRAAYRRR